jgi:hypothetical protein
MKMRLTKPSAAQGAWLIAGRSAAGAVLLAVTVAACTGGGSSVPTIFTPTPQTGGPGSSTTHPGGHTPSPTGGVSSSKSASASTSPTAHPSKSSGSSSPRASASTKPPASTSPSAAPSSAPATHTSAPVAPAFPSTAPETGGGGTAGLQDGLVFGIGGGAVLLGIGSLAYRRRLARKFATKRPSPKDPLDREPVDR